MSIDPAAAGGLLSQAGLASPYVALADRGDGIMLAQDVGAGVTLRLGVTMSTEGRQEPFETSRDTVVVGELVRAYGPGSALGLQVGSVDEQHGLLDTRGSGALGVPEGATTSFTGLAGRWALADRLALFGQGSLASPIPGPARAACLRRFPRCGARASPPAWPAAIYSGTATS